MPPADYQVPDIGIIEWSAKSGNEPIKTIQPGAFYVLQIDGFEDLEKTKIRKFLPFTNINVSNQSGQDIRVQIGNQLRSGFTVGSKRACSMSEIPFKYITIQNIGTEPINENEVIVICSNDMTGILKYVEMVELGLILPLVRLLPLER